MNEPKEMVCNGCFRVFLSTSHTFNSAEKERCPYCKSLDTTPMLEVRIGAKRVKHFQMGFKSDAEIRTHANQS